MPHVFRVNHASRAHSSSGSTDAGDARRTPQRWSHVSLAQMLEDAGNRLHDRGEGFWESGHEPVHSSRSGRCLWIDTNRSRWICRSCQESGDAVALVMSLRGLTHRQAIAWLTVTYGAPRTSGQGRRRRRSRVLRADIP
jgi:hypothetical protein